MNKLGINYTKYFEKSAAECFKLFSEIGFDAVFTDFGGFHEVEKNATEAEKNKLLYESLHAPFKNMNEIWIAGEMGNEVLRGVTDSIEAAGKFGVPFVVVHLSSSDNPPLINDTGHARFDKIVECAVKNNVTVCFENQRKIANIAFAFEAYDKIENVGFCWDIGHEYCLGGGAEYMNLFGQKLKYTHIHDNLMVHNGDMHLIPFEGKIDFKKQMDFIKKYNYKGTLTLEILPSNANRYSNTDYYKGITIEEYYKKAYAAGVRLRDMLK